MIFTEKISLADIGGKKYKIRLIEPNSNREAVLTHYIHNNSNGVSCSYRKGAIEATKDILKYKYPED